MAAVSRWLGDIYIPPQTPPLAKEWLWQWNIIAYWPISFVYVNSENTMTAPAVWQSCLRGVDVFA